MGQESHLDQINPQVWRRLLYRDQSVVKRKVRRKGELLLGHERSNVSKGDGLAARGAAHIDLGLNRFSYIVRNG